MLSRDFREFIELLNARRVEYLVVGGYAVIAHGYPRYTGDMDVWIKPSPENAERVVEVLRQFGFGARDITAETFTTAGAVLQLGYPPNRIDVLTSATGLDFSDCYSRRLTVEFGGATLSMIALEDLKRNKQATGRHRDLDDLENLGGPPKA